MTEERSKLIQALLEIHELAPQYPSLKTDRELLNTLRLIWRCADDAFGEVNRPKPVRDQTGWSDKQADRDRAEYAAARMSDGTYGD